MTKLALMGDERHQPGNNCTHCGKGEMRLIAGRIGKLKEPGHMNIFQCAVCGQFENRDVAHQPSGKRT